MATPADDAVVAYKHAPKLACPREGRSHDLARPTTHRSTSRPSDAPDPEQMRNPLPAQRLAATAETREVDRPRVGPAESVREARDRLAVFVGEQVDDRRGSDRLDVGPEDSCQSRTVPPAVQLPKGRTRLGHGMRVRGDRVPGRDEPEQPGHDEHLDLGPTGLPRLRGDLAVHVPVEPPVRGHEPFRLKHPMGRARRDLFTEAQEVPPRRFGGRIEHLVRRTFIAALPLPGAFGDEGDDCRPGHALAYGRAGIGLFRNYYGPQSHARGPPAGHRQERTHDSSFDSKTDFAGHPSDVATP